MSSITQPGIKASITTTANVTARRAISLTGAHATAGAKVLGVSINDTTSGQATAVVISGVSAITSGAAVAVGDYVKSDATGRAVPSAVVDNQLPADAFGLALEAATAADQIIRVKLI